MAPTALWRRQLATFGPEIRKLLAYARGSVSNFLQRNHLPSRHRKGAVIAIGRRQLANYHLEIFLAAAGLACIANAAFGWWHYNSFQRHYAAAFVAPSPTLSASLAKPLGQPIGRLSVPRLQLSTVIVEGDDDQSLDLGAGHAVNSAPLGGSGNVVVAGHRDSAFWPLRNVRIGDRIRITADKPYAYVVRSTAIVDPSDTALLQASNDRLLTLVTCYPFRHVGPAPKRFIVRASLIEKP